MLGRNTVLLVALGAALLIAAAPAGAATPFTAGLGQEPSVAVGSDGTGHVAWLTHQTADQPATIGYCRVPAGAQDCNHRQTLSFPEGSDAHAAGQVKVFAPAPNKVVVVGACWNCPGLPYRMFRFISLNNGTSFPDVLEIGQGLSPEGHGIWLDDAGVFAEAAGGRVKGAKGSPATPGEGVLYASGCICAYGPEVTRVPGSTKLVAATNDLDFVKYGVFLGDLLDPVQINDPLKWDKDKTLTDAESDNRDTSLATGPNGVSLAYLETGSTPDRVGFRRFDSTSNTFGAPTYVDGNDTFDDGAAEPDHFQDPAGRSHFVWRVTRDDGRLRYRVSDTSGANLSAAANLALREAFAQPEIAAGADGKGFATWFPGPGANGNIRVVPIDPQPEAVTPAPTPTPTPTPTPVPVRPSVLPIAYSGPTATTTAPAPGGSTISLGVPKSCVAPGATYKVRMGLKAKRRKGRVVVKLTRVDFFIGIRLAKTDRKAPFVQTLRVQIGTTSGTTIRLRARGRIKIRTGKPRTKTLRATIRVC